MKAVHVVSGRGVPLKRSDVDTDQIIPAEWLKRVERTGFEKGLFSTWRDDRNFVLNDERYSGVDLEGNPDFAQLAKAYGILGLNLKRAADLNKVLEKALAHPGPVVVNVEVVKHEEVYPMVPPGKPLEDTVMEHPRRKPGRP